MKTTEQISELLREGQNIVVDDSKATEQLIEIVREANKNQQVTIRGASKKTNPQLVEIARNAGPGCVTFDLT